MGWIPDQGNALFHLFFALATREKAKLVPPLNTLCLKIVQQGERSVLTLGSFRLSIFEKQRET